MSPELASKYNPLQVVSILVSLMVYNEFNAGQRLMYMQHMHIEFGESHICHDLVLYQNVNNSSYLNPLLHESLDVDHKMVILFIFLYHNTFLHLCVKRQNYPEHDILCLSIFF